MKQYAVYESPIDYKGKFVVRGFSIKDGQVIPDDDPLIVSDSLREARKSIPDGFVNLGRSAKDDDCMLEVWI